MRTFVAALTAPAKRYRQHIKDYSSYRAIVPPAAAMTARPARPSSRSADKPNQDAGWSTAFWCGAQKSSSKAIYKGKRVRPRAVFGHSDHVFAPLFEPAVPGVKLVSQNQPAGFGHSGPLVARRQRSEQYFTVAPLPRPFLAPGEWSAAVVAGFAWQTCSSAYRVRLVGGRLDHVAPSPTLQNRFASDKSSGPIRLDKAWRCCANLRYATLKTGCSHSTDRRRATAFKPTLR